MLTQVLSINAQGAMVIWAWNSGIAICNLGIVNPERAEFYGESCARYGKEVGKRIIKSSVSLSYIGMEVEIGGGQ